MFYGQCKQDEFLETYVFKGFRGGTFADVGAHDGKTINNTLFFEESRGWSGICVEPIKQVFDQLAQNRPNCVNMNCAIDETSGTAEFICNTGYTEMISGLKNHYDPRHEERLSRELEEHKGTKTVITVPTRTLASIFEENDVKHVHYMSIDVEGAEFAVIKSIDFEKVFIDVIQFENNYNDTSLPIVEYLATKGYQVRRSQTKVWKVLTSFPH
jgi:FkbM family methyltransferase